MGYGGALNSSSAGDEGPDDAVVVAIFVGWENVALFPARLRQLELCAIAFYSYQRVILAAKGNKYVYAKGKVGL